MSSYENHEIMTSQLDFLPRFLMKFEDSKDFAWAKQMVTGRLTKGDNLKRGDKNLFPK